jgi:hypothetical protein
MSENDAGTERYTKKRLYDLIPAVYRQRDAKLAKPLEDLIGIIAEHAAALENDIGGLYDNWFIETCNEWATSYKADLVGAKSLSASRVSSLSTTEEVSQRAYVANTVAYRRRKGTILMLEELAGDVTQWGAKAVEFFKLLGTTQNVNHIRLVNYYETPDLRNISTLELLNSPFDTIAHTVEVRRIRSNRGLYNIPNVGIFLWRLQAFQSLNTTASPYYDPAAVDKSSTRTFRFSPLGYDAPIFNSLDDEPDISEMAQEQDLPVPIRRRALYDNPDRYYGKDLSIFLRVKYSGESEYHDVATREIQVCNLEKWAKSCADRVAIDPENGRISLPKEATDLRVIYYYGFSGKIGGGFYKRPILSSTGKLIKISKGGDGDNSTIQSAIDVWEQDGYGDVVFKILDSEVYDEVLVLGLPVACKVAIVAVQEQRPILRSLTVQGESGSSLTLDGLWFNNNDDNDGNNPSNAQVIKVEPGDMASLAITHCTLVPGRDTSMRKVAVGLRSYIRRQICTWENIMTNQSDADRLKEYLKKNFAGWITDTMEFKKEDGDDEKVTLSDITDGNEKNNSLTMTLDQESQVAHLDVTTGDQEQKNVYEFIVIKESGQKNLYINGGNDDLQISLDRSITGRIQILDSLIFTWNRIPAEEDANRLLRTFLKSNFYVPWLTEATPFEKDGSGSSVISAKSESGNNSLTITLQGSKAILVIISKDADGNEDRDTYEFVVMENRVYNQSDALLSSIDSIIDGKGDNEAIEARSVRLENTTVFGKTRVSKLSLASNVMFTDIVSSTITQEGCVRFSYIPPGSKTPQRYLCQPEEGKEEPATVRPAFTSEVYGDPGYAQLHRNIAAKIFQGGDNGAEMGAFNHLLQPQRIADLKSSLDEYLRFGLETGVFLVT